MLKKSTKFMPPLFPRAILAALATLGLTFGQISSFAEGHHPPVESPPMEDQGNVDQPSSPDQDELRSPVDRKRMAEMALLDRLLSMPPERLSHLRQTIERVEGMSLEEREELRKKVRHFRHLHPRERSRMFRNWEELPKETRTLLRRHWEGMSHEERRARRHELESMEIRERMKFHKELIHRLQAESKGEKSP